MEREREIEMKRAGENSDIKFWMSLTFGCDAMRCDAEEDGAGEDTGPVR
jgi:hypothetical protein